MPEDFCPDCGEWGCDGCTCDDIDAPCTFCGDLDCDGSGYNCPDLHYQEYNLRGWPEEVSGDA
jgi:hypothetical protein